MDNLIEPNKFPELFKGDKLLLDVRSEAEYGKGSLPGSCNIPILNNSEREQVGVRYKNNGSDAAIKLGHELVNGQTRDQRIKKWIKVASDPKCAGLLCWRGGMRSEIAQNWVAEAGVELPRIQGGYKALRNFLIDQLNCPGLSTKLVLIAGRTGSGKTKLLHDLSKYNKAFIDLESLAKHKGSAFGGLFDEQPAPASFENFLAVELMQCQKQSNQIFVEDESRTIGVLSIPASFFKAMSNARLVLLDSSMEVRVQNIIEDYICTLLRKYQKESVDAFKHLEQGLCACVSKIRTRLGDERSRSLLESIKIAINKHSKTDQESSHSDWIEMILKWYYDPLYDFQIQKNSERIVYKGSYDEVLQRCANENFNL